MPDYVKIAEEAWRAAEEASASDELDEAERFHRQRSINAALLAMIGLSERTPPPSTSRGAW